MRTLPPPHGGRHLGFAMLAPRPRRRHGPQQLAETRTARRRTSADDAAALAVKLRPGVAVETAGLLGDPQQILVDLSTDAHLVVMGSRGREPLRTKLLGSVSSAVVKQARCPVLVRRPHPEGSRGAGVVVSADVARVRTCGCTTFLHTS